MHFIMLWNKAVCECVVVVWSRLQYALIARDRVVLTATDGVNRHSRLHCPARG